ERPLARHLLARCVGSGQRPEVGKADGDGDRAKRPKALAREAYEDLAGEGPHALEDEDLVQRVHLERLLLADRLRLPLVGDGALGEPVRLGVEVLAAAAAPLRELGDLESAQVAARATVPLVALDFRPRTGDRANATRPQ